ncbi:MAG: diaminopimelate decarboxylase [Gemmatimonadota bacterium]
MGTGVLKPAFPRGDAGLTAGRVALADLAEHYGTPLYVYDAEIVRNRYDAVVHAFAGADPLVAYSVKANGTLALLHLLARLGAGADIVSGGELFRALRAGVPASRIVFAGVGKTEAEIVSALEAGILAFNVEGAEELDRIEASAARLGVRAGIAVRVNPDVLSPTPHEYTRTGHADTKFGVSLADTPALYRRAARSDHLDPIGIDMHIGSQITSPEPYARALEQTLHVVDALAREGIALRFFDLGGGFGVSYDGGPAMPLGDLASVVVPPVRARGLSLILEPGRFLVAEAGVLVTRVLGIKKGARKRFVITDGGMTELLRPSHYGGYHVIESVTRADGREPEPVDVVGPICETGDFLARDRSLPLPDVGELLAVRTVGAYGFTMASNYNARRRPAEVMVDGRRVDLIRTRETFEDLVRGEQIPDEAPLT